MAVAHLAPSRSAHAVAATGLRLGASDGRRRTRYARREAGPPELTWGVLLAVLAAATVFDLRSPAGAGLADRRGDRRRGAAGRVGGAAGADGEPGRGRRRGAGVPALRLAGVAGRGGRPAPGGGRRLAGLAGRPVGGLVDGRWPGRRSPSACGPGARWRPVAGPRPGHRRRRGRGRGPSRSPTYPRSWPGPSSRSSPAPAPEPPARRPARTPNGERRRGRPVAGSGA